jgi:pimeloyl-ACP methyl ester carboxylesterase
MKNIRNYFHKTIQCVTIFALCYFTAIFSHATPDDNTPKAEYLKIDSNPNGSPSRLVMFAKRYRRDGAKPIVLAHGFLNNDEAMDIWARKFYNLGYDVWVFNHLGFGLKDRMSYTKNYQPGDYGFANLLNGMDQVIHHIVKTTNMKVIYTSFSMGGMTFYQYVAGSYGEDQNGLPKRSKTLAKERQELIAEAITIGAPNYDMRGLGLFLRAITKIGYLLLDGPLKNAHFQVPLALGMATEKNIGVGGLFALGQKVIRKEILTPILADAMHLPNMGEHQNNLNYVFNFNFSNPHTDILRSFARMYRFSHRLPAPEITFPNLVVMGSLDRLAPPKQLLWHQKGLTQQAAPHRAILLGGYGHLDLIYDKAVDEALPYVDNFIKNPQAFYQQTPEIIELGKFRLRERLLVDRFNSLVNTDMQNPQFLPQIDLMAQQRSCLKIY